MNSLLDKFHKEIDPREDGVRRFEFRCYGCTALLGKYALDPHPWFFEIKCTHSNCKALRSHGNCVPTRLYEFRCTGIDAKRSEKFGEEVICNKLLARVLPGSDIEIKCPRCGSVQNAKNRNKDETTGKLV